ncbi:hypothetical protein G9P44_000234 [Scheffersomyces stipitis]|nr:hypothetical protein G9P44_000234 [Scheffersomyces stipitis]
MELHQDERKHSKGCSGNRECFGGVFEDKRLLTEEQTNYYGIEKRRAVNSIKEEEVCADQSTSTFTIVPST